MSTPFPVASVSLPGLECKDIAATGASLRGLADGSVQVAVDRAELRSVKFSLPAGRGVAARVTVQDALLRLGPSASGPSFDLLGLRAADVQLEGIELELDHRPGGMAAGGWRFDALDALDGQLRVFIRDAAWVVDADITVPLAAGRLDFDDVVVDHVGPNSSMGISRNSIYIDAPNSVGRTDLYRFTAPSVPGAQFESRGGGRVTDRGSIDFKEFLEAMLAAPSEQPFGAVGSREVEVMLDRTKLSGELRLGDGAIGSTRHHVALSGRDQGRNRIGLTAAVLGQRLVVRVPDLSASGAGFELFGHAGRCGAITGNLELQATGLSGSTAAGLAATVHRLGVKDVVLGSVELR